MKLFNENENRQKFDVVIIGGGAAGISAALWCDELGLNTLLLEAGAELGGQLLRVYNPIKNHLGIETENGRELRDIFARQIQERAFTVKFNSRVSQADLEKKRIKLTNGECFEGKFLIIATGVRRRKLNVEGEEKFRDRGIIVSGKRDEAMVEGKSVCIVGGGDAAAENALILAEKAAQIFLVHRRREFSTRPEFMEKILENQKIKILTATTVKKIRGAETVESVELQNTETNENFNLPVEAVLLRIGVEPNTELFREKLKLDDTGYIEINSRCETSVKNIFAVGDVANPPAPTVSSAVGMGATAGKVIFDILQRREY